MMGMTKSLSVRLHELLKSEFKNSSQNLAKFTRSHRYVGLKNHYRMYRDEDGDLHLGFVDDNGVFCGRKLLRLACGDKETFAYKLENPTDVTEWFIEEYKSKGMCAYTDMRHEWDLTEPDSTLEDGTTRSCIHCHKAETLNSKMVRKTWWE